MGEAQSPSPIYRRTPFGKDMLKHFSIDPSYVNINHGSFGASPLAIREKQREYQDQGEARPDIYIRYTYPKLSDKSREAIAKLLNCPASTVVFVPNATTGVNVVLRNIVWNRDSKDEILYFKHIYGACLKTIEYVCEATHNVVNPRQIAITYPMEDSDLLDLFRKAIKDSRAAYKRPRIAIFDTVSSLPGLRMPFEALTAICKEEGVLSLIDGAHGVGHIPIDLTAIDPDFFVSNAHKWLFVPRGCAVFYVPERNQALIRSSLPTSHGFVPIIDKGVLNVMPSAKSTFITQFEANGTIDNTNFVVVDEAIRWREEVCGGEAAIIEYNTNLAREGGKVVAKILGTEILDNITHTLTDCSLVNVRLPLEIGEEKVAGTNTIKRKLFDQVPRWIQTTLFADSNTFIPIWAFQGQIWARLSAQIYLDIGDFEKTGEALKKVCEKAGSQESLY
ncbi:uncharacterized protein L3040_004881 [Drepanopeziza brunnea f. sp. 'multigermtubi']|uniref:Aminotransferase family protein (LolT) n=1 Tax=Marssonina brunnea f. sp. multigermtubi (strain MB_m1) TaxID=1072389 RepID=K1XMD9_MARBU|nr:aminotransferase family protein (LolT) [Drepanopeziza brunnea f. sp. 'multigermtubi' MB_m1]EKD21658.1 aminotransferase family protein (LolT) [Drepanopeziza brunnea f. sp. 'multigermtubi' MB_m1]KAJ5042329.1 hypothetical protein L3040_004881 [Drepanopeziza brunnea f. sp. 'multigermtubi']